MVAVILGGMFVCAIGSLLLAWKSRSRRLQTLAIALSLPAGFVGFQLLTHVGSLGGVMFGIIGASTPVLSALLVRHQRQTA